MSTIWPRPQRRQRRARRGPSRPPRRAGPSAGGCAVSGGDAARRGTPPGRGRRAATARGRLRIDRPMSDARNALIAACRRAAGRPTGGRRRRGTCRRRAGAAKKARSRNRASAAPMRPRTGEQVGDDEEPGLLRVGARRLRSTGRSGRRRRRTSSRGRAAPRATTDAGGRPSRRSRCSGGSSMP